MTLAAVQFTSVFKIENGTLNAVIAANRKDDTEYD